MNGNNSKKIDTIISLLFCLRTKIAGLRKKDMHKILNAYVPIKDMICIISILFEKLYAIKFQGKPVKIVPLKNSIKPNKREIRNKLLTGLLIFMREKKYVARP